MYIHTYIHTCTCMQVTVYVVDRAAEKEQSPGEFLRSKVHECIRKFNKDWG